MQRMYFPLCIVCLFLTGDVMAQCPSAFVIQHEFRYGEERKQGKFSYCIWYNSSTVKNQYSGDPRNLGLNFSGETKGQLKLRFELDKKAAKDYQIAFYNDCIRSNPYIRYKPVAGVGLVLNKDKTSGEIEFEVIENGAGIMPLKFAVLPPKEKGIGACEETLELKYRIEGLNSACEQAEATFAANKISGISALEKYLGESKNGLCADKFRKIVAEHQLYENARNAIDKKDYETAKSACAEYEQKYASGYYIEEVRALKKGIPAPPETNEKKGKDKVKKETAPVSSACEQEWQKIKDAVCAEAIRDFINKNQNCSVIEEARQRLRSIPLGFTIALTPASATATALTGQHIRWKNLSLDDGLKIEPSDGQTVKATFGSEGEYRIKIEDSCKKDTLLVLTNNFYARMETGDKGRLFTIHIFGGTPPYTATLTNTKTGREHPVLRRFIEGNRIELSKKDLTNMLMKDVYSIEVKDSKHNDYILKEYIDNSKHPPDIAMIIIVLLFTTAAGLLLYLVFLYFKNKKRKETIYDIEY